MRSIALLLSCSVLVACARGGTSSPLPASLPYGASVRTDGSGYKTIYSFKFNSTASGSYPQGALTNLNGTLYGTTQGGGAHNVGTVFSITPAGVQKIIYSFKGGTDGANPMYGALVEVGGALYGTTSVGGKANFGTVFRITTAGVEKAIYAFKGGKDGDDPTAGLTNVGGTLYGTTEYGGSLDDGTVFKITTGGAEKVVHSFIGPSNGMVDGAKPGGGALVDVKGTLYGTTGYGGGDSFDGTVFEISKSGKEKVIHVFAGGHDGQNPEAGLTEAGGALYGTTCGGGAGSQGTVFKMTTTGHEDWIYSFKNAADGTCPGNGNLTLVGGALFGTTTKGGTGLGTVYKITTSGVEKVLHSFAGGSDGSTPQSGLTSLGGSLYGTTPDGGGSGYDGTAYMVRP